MRRMSEKTKDWGVAGEVAVEGEEFIVSKVAKARRMPLLEP